ncbi:MAG: DUF255 domain-containing protein [Alphaproteobacteria bacterium]
MEQRSAEQNPAENQLANSSSLYLRLHASNPVNWMPWGTQPFILAKQQNKPILLSSGYAACHWCHVMARESFSDPQIAQILNQYFISIKLDREQHPDVDALYIEALARLGQSGGWPLNLFLTPSGQPFLGGTYWPPKPAFERPAFRQVIVAVANAWLDPEAQAKLLEQGKRLHHALHSAHHANLPNIQNTEITETTETTDSEDSVDSVEKQLHRATQQLFTIEDKENGGIGTAPKFPNVPFLNLWLWSAADKNLHIPDNTPDNLKSNAARSLSRALEEMARGGIYDHFGGGFARYATDPIWHVPHFEKMLYDNALLLRLYALSTPLFDADMQRRSRQVIADSIQFFRRDLQIRTLELPGAALAASLDAESNHQEGAHYVWQYETVINALNALESNELQSSKHTKAQLQKFCQLYSITPQGNWAGAEHELGQSGYSIPHRLENRSAKSETFEFSKETQDARRALLLQRTNPHHPPRPRRDPRVIAEWNGMAVVALAEIAQREDNRGNRDVLQFAEQVFNFAASVLTLEGEGVTLAHSWSGPEIASGEEEPSIENGQTEGEGLLEDYAWMVEAALALFAATGKPELLQRAAQWMETAKQRFSDAQGRWWRNPEGPLLMRLTAHQDGPAPSPLAAAVSAMARLALLTGEPQWGEVAHQALKSAPPRNNDLEAASLLCAELTLKHGALAILATPKEQTEQTKAEAKQLRDSLFATCHPALTLMENFDPQTLAPTHPAAAALPVDGRPALYLCHNGICSPPRFA